MNPYPLWLNAGDNSWQMTAATLVGLMSIPALAVLYGGLVQRKWAINTVMMVFTTFCLVLIVWVLWGYKLGFGTPLVSTFLGDPRTVLGHSALQGQANIPLLNGLMPSFRIPGGVGDLLPVRVRGDHPDPVHRQRARPDQLQGLAGLRAAVDHVRLRVNAFLLWGGGYWAGKGALDFSGGYVIHLAAGVVRLRRRAR